MSPTHSAPEGASLPELRYLRRYLERWVQDSNVIEDLVQETWIRVCRHRDRLRDPQALRGWVLRIAFHVAMDWHRQESRRTRYESEASVRADGRDSAGAWVTDAVDTRWSHREESARWSRRLRRALATLSLRDRGLVIGHYYVGFTCRQLAHRTGMTEANVKVRLYRARGRLRQVLPEPGDGGSFACIEFSRDPSPHRPSAELVPPGLFAFGPRVPSSRRQKGSA